MTLLDRICIHACYHRWNPVRYILDDFWNFKVRITYGRDYPGWKELR